MLLFTTLCLIYPNYTCNHKTVFENNLVTVNQTSQSILNFYNLTGDPSNFRLLKSKQNVLSFVTPWNPQGYDLALKFGNKFNIIVPIWFRIVNDQGKFKLEGTDAINQEWLNEMRKQHPKVNIVPRIIFENTSPRQFIDSLNPITKLIQTEYRSLNQKYHFDGIFFEIPQYISNSQSMKYIPKFIKSVRKVSSKLKILLDIPSKEKVNYHPSFSYTLKDIINSVDFAFVSAYELPCYAISPISAYRNIYNWIFNEISSKFVNKIIIGIPFFGFNYSPTKREYIFGDDLIRILSNNKVLIKYNNQDEEHIMFYHSENESKSLYYPTLYFLEKRFEVVAKYGFAGVGFWEMAQGLPYFFDLL